jgi:hypothetical protein
MRRIGTVAVLEFIVAAALAGCVMTSPGPGSPVSSVQQAQAQVSFPVITPACLPSLLDPRPTRVAVDPASQGGGQAVYIDYGYREPKARPAGGFPPVTLLEQSSRPTRGLVIQGGERRILDGTEVAIDMSSGSPSLEWAQGETLIQLIATIPLDDTMRVYHSIVTHSSSCDLPKT